MAPAVAGGVSIYLSVDLSIYPSIYESIYLSICILEKGWADRFRANNEGSAPALLQNHVYYS